LTQNPELKTQNPKPRTQNPKPRTQNPELRTQNSEPLPTLILIAALAEDSRVIGRDKDLPWHLPEDLKRFKRLTSGHPLLMGRVTFESIVHQFGGPLPDRRHLILSRSGDVPSADHPDVETYASIDAALDAVDDGATLFIGGGADVYEQFLPHADRLELTLVDGDYDGDTFFPEYEHLVGDVFEVTNVDARDGFRFVTYDRT